MIANPQLSSSFIKSRNEGYNDEDIRKDALLAGWSNSEIDSAFEALNQNVSAPIPKPSDFKISNLNETKKEIIENAVDLNSSVKTPVPQQNNFVLKPIENKVESVEQFKVEDQIKSISINKPVIEENPLVSIKTMPSASNNFVENKKTSSGKSKLITTFIIIVFLLIAIGGGVFAYTSNIIPFSKNIYKENNFFSGILGKVSQIESSTYSLKFELYTKEREPDAQPFDFKSKNIIDKKVKIERDSQRIEDVDMIISQLLYGGYNNTQKGTYPDSLKDIEKSMSDIGDFYDGDKKPSIYDPLSKELYSYSVSGDKKDFKLEIEFETEDAIKSITSSFHYTSSTKIVDKKVTFTKDSDFYLSSLQEAQTFWESFTQYSEYVPNDFKIDGLLKIANDLKKSEWKFDFDGNADFADADYKLNFEVLKKANEYFMIFNEIPEFFSVFTTPKNQWIKFDFPIATSTSEIYTDSDIIAKIAKFADEEKIFIFKSKPYKDKVDNKDLYRYDLKIRKEAVAPFYKKILDEISRKEGSDELLVDNQEMMKIIESEEFQESFDYYDKNLQFTLWTDKEGFPVLMKYSIRNVPPDDFVSFKNKQVMLDITISLEDINKPIDIKAPENSKTYEEIVKEMYPYNDTVDIELE